jgi:hypothetical protein
MAGSGARFDVASVALLVNELRGYGSTVTSFPSRLTTFLARRLPVQARRDIQEEYSLTATRINQGLTVKRSDGVVELRGSGRGIGLVSFGATYPGPSAPGVSVSVTKSGGRRTVNRAFIPKGKNPNQVFKRKELASGLLVGRSPIVRLFGPSIAQMLKKPERVERLTEFAVEGIQKEAARLLRL